MPPSSKPPVPSYNPIAENIETVAAMHSHAQQNVSKHQKVVETGTWYIGRPSVLYCIVAIDILWITLNLVAPQYHLRAIDPPPFYWLQGATTIGSLFVAMIVLITQNRQGRQNERRDHLDLQINLLAEQKITKIISLIEELRRDLPNVQNRHDPEIEHLTQSTDAHAIVEALEAKIEMEVASVNSDPENETTA